jgi:response regulator NasT
MSGSPSLLAAPSLARSTPAAPIRVLIAGGDAPRLREQLAAAGHDVVAAAATAGEAVARAAALHPDAVLVDAALPDGLGTAAVTQLMTAGPDAWVPAVILCTAAADALLDPDAELTGAAAVLLTPASLAALDGTVRLAVARAREFAALRAECREVRRRLEERKVIERAKGILMRRTGTTEQEAYRILQRSSQDKATPMITLAQAVLDSEPGAERQAPGARS